MGGDRLGIEIAEGAVDLEVRILKALQQVHHISMIDIARPGSAGNEIIRSAAIQGHPPDILVQRQSCGIVLEQHHTLGSTLASDGRMSLQVGLIGVFISLESRSLLNQIQYASHISVQVLPGQLSTLDAIEDLSVLCLTPRLQHIIAGPYLPDTVTATIPIGHHCALIPPVVTKDMSQEFLALRRILAIHMIVGRHHRPWMGLGDSDFERLEINLPQGTLRQAGIVVHTVGLLVVHSKMLEARTYAIALHAFDVGCRRLSGQQGILGIIFKVTATERIPLNVDSRCQQHVDAIFLHLVSDGSAHLLN